MNPALEHLLREMGWLGGECSDGRFHFDRPAMGLIPAHSDSLSFSADTHDTLIHLNIVIRNDHLLPLLETLHTLQRKGD